MNTWCKKKDIRSLGKLPRFFLLTNSIVTPERNKKKIFETEKRGGFIQFSIFEYFKLTTT